MARMGERRGAYRVIVGKPEGRRTLGRPRIDGRIILRWIIDRLDWGCIDRIDLVQDRDR